jgi:hypothetical protein
MKSIMCAIALIVALSAAPTCAAVVTVMPDPQYTDMPVGQVGLGETTCTNGWRIVTNALGYGALCNWGPSTYQSRSGGFFAHYEDWYRDVWHPDQNFGRGAFFASCDEYKGTFSVQSGDRTPSTVWLGTDTWNGTALHGRTLGSITKLEYYVFCGKIPVRGAGIPQSEGWWEASSWWNGPQQPIQLQFQITNPSDPTEQRQVWYRPWGYNFVGDDGMDEPGSQKGRWQYFNCMASQPGNQGKWYMPSCGTSPNTLEWGWPDPDYPDPLGGTPWEQMMRFRFPVGNYPPLSQWTLSDPSTIWKTPGWNGKTVPAGNINCTATGYPLNFFLGARVSLVAQQKDANGNLLPRSSLFLQGGSQTWVNSSYGARSQIDRFTIGFDGVDETYDFEPPLDQPPLQVVATNMAMWQRVPGDTSKRWPEWPWANEQPIAYSPGLAQQPMPLEPTYKRTTLSTPTVPERGFLVKIVGKVMPQTEGVNQYFVLDDGSKLSYQMQKQNMHYDSSLGWVVDPNPYGAKEPWFDAWTSTTPDGSGVVKGRIRVYLQNDAFRGAPLWIGPGDIVSVVGLVQPLEWWSTCPIMWTNINKVQKLQNY